MYKFLGWLSLIIAAFIAVLGFAQKAEPKELQKHSELLAHLVVWLQTYVWILIPILSGTLVLIKWLRDFIGAPWVKEAIHSVLDVISEVVFVGEDNIDSAYDRVTLFRRKPFHFCLRRWPWHGWLVPVIRSGHVSQKTTIIFRAPDRPDGAEGIAGYCWANQKQVEINGLPKLTSGSTMDDIQSYGKETHMDNEWVRTNLPQARAYFAIPIKAKGRPWGAVVVDSRYRILGSRLKSLTPIVGTVLSELVGRSGK
jgi:hypothetical protein